MPKWCGQGLSTIGEVYLKGISLPSFYLGLYKNAVEPGADDDMTDIIEAGTPGAGGYERMLLDPGDWTENPSGIWTHVAKAFLASGADWGAVTGYFITTAETGVAGDLVCVRHFPLGPYEMNDGSALGFVPVAANVHEYSPFRSYEGSVTVVFLPGSESLLLGAEDTDLETYLDNAGRLTDWSYCGVPGGIPVRTTIYAALGVPGQASTYAQTVTAAEVNAALAACPAGQIVYLYPGTYNLGQITFASQTGVTLAGAGAGQTIVNSTASPSVTATQRYPVNAGAVAMTGGYTRGSMAVTVASAASFTAGALVFFDEEASPDLWADGIGTYYRTGLTTPWNMTASRCHRFTSRITSIVGTTLNLATPLPFSFSAALTPRAYPLNGAAGASLCGLEDMTIVSSTGLDYAVQFIGADRCWVKDVEAYGYVGTTGTFQYQWSAQCEMRRNYIHDANGYPAQADGYAYFLYYGCSGCLVEDNITQRTATAGVINGSAGNAMLYNRFGDSRRASHGFLDQSIIFNHGPHSTYNLIEGNVCQRIQDDGTHGNASFTTLFRNWVHGIYPPGGTPTTRRLVDFCRGGYYHTVVGNIIGDSSYSPAVYEFDGVAAINCCYILGYPGMDSISMAQFTGQPFVGWDKPVTVPDADVAGTILRHGNFDYYNNAPQYLPDVTHIIPSSLFYGSRPAYWGSLDWPAIGPDVTGYVKQTPASRRWANYLASGDVADLFAAAPGA